MELIKAILKTIWCIIVKNRTKLNLDMKSIKKLKDKNIIAEHLNNIDEV